jgi:hypothetical protein
LLIEGDILDVASDEEMTGEDLFFILQYLAFLEQGGQFAFHSVDSGIEVKLTLHSPQDIIILSDFLFKISDQTQ